jgi:nuclear pore complex protein Nup188
MSRNPDSTYFPALDACLSGTETLIPWTTAYTGLSDLSSARNSSTLESFVSDDESRDTLARPLAPFQQANAQTKSLFDAKTAPINVSQQLLQPAAIEGRFIMDFKRAWDR